MTDDPLHDALFRRVGTSIGEKYRIDSVLGIGGMAVVYQATHRNGSKVAIKMLLPQYESDPAVVTRFVREGYAANAVGHDGVVRVFDDAQTESGATYLVMELLEGASVEEIQAGHGGKLPQSWAIAFVYQLLEVLAAAHAKGIIHRDIKPSNVFFTKKNEIKLLDFGIARYRAGDSSQKTLSQHVLGTPAFAAPEKMFGQQDSVDLRSDLYAAGATLFYLISGQPPRGNEGFVRALNEVVAGADAELDSVVSRALAERPGDRWESAEAMQQALSGIYTRIQGLDLPDALTTRSAMHHRTALPPDQAYSVARDFFLHSSGRVAVTSGAEAVRSRSIGASEPPDGAAPTRMALGSPSSRSVEAANAPKTDRVFEQPLTTATGLWTDTPSAKGSAGHPRGFSRTQLVVTVGVALMGGGGLAAVAFFPTSAPRPATTAPIGTLAVAWERPLPPLPAQTSAQDTSARSVASAVPSILAADAGPVPTSSGPKPRTTVAPARIAPGPAATSKPIEAPCPNPPFCPKVK